MEYQKPPLTFEQQLDLLISRGLLVRDKKAALNYLKHISYYRLSAYFLPFKTSEQFKENVFFDDVINLYTFDSKLRLLILEAIEPIEITIRTQLIYYLSHTYGAFGYLNPANFSNRFRHAEWLKHLEETIAVSNETFIKHFKAKYTNNTHLPLWMALEVISFGSLSKLYRGLLSKDQKAIAEKYGLEDRVFYSWLHVLVYIRNLCAHHARLWNRTLTLKPMLPKKLNKFKGLNNNKMFCLLMLICYLQEQIKLDSAWRNELIDLINKRLDITVMAMGFPINWRERFC